MNNRTITGRRLAAVVVIAVWWMFVFSPVRSDASKVDERDRQRAGRHGRLEAEAKQLEELEARPRDRRRELDRLRAAVPERPSSPSFIDAANAARRRRPASRGSSISPGAAATTGSADDGADVDRSRAGTSKSLDYLDRLEDMSRLVVVDQVTLERWTTTPTSVAGTDVDGVADRAHVQPGDQLGSDRDARPRSES